MMYRMKKKIKLIPAVLMLTMVLVLTFPLAASASDVLEPDRKGALSVDTKTTDGKPVTGAEITLYKVADVVEDSNIGYAYKLTGDFAKGGFDVSGLSEEDAGALELAAKLEAFVNSNSITGKSVLSDANGNVSWSGLDLGVYLVVNTKNADGYEKMSTFCVTVPRFIDGKYIYDVNANPKPLAIKAKEPPKKVPPKKVPPKLPQTGQLWWPVPVMTLIGMLFIAGGAIFRRRSYNA